jgi:hypothetical protein
LSRRRSPAGRAGVHPCSTPYSVEEADPDPQPRRSVGSWTAQARRRLSGRPVSFGTLGQKAAPGEFGRAARSSRGCLRCTRFNPPEKKIEMSAMRSCGTRAMGDLAERYGAGQRLARQGTPNDFWWSPGGCARWWNRTPAGKPIASLLRLPRSKRVFQKSMIRNRARGLVLRITDPMPGDRSHGRRLRVQVRSVGRPLSGRLRIPAEDPRRVWSDSGHRGRRSNGA